MKYDFKEYVIKPIQNNLLSLQDLKYELTLCFLPENPLGDLSLKQ